MLMRLYADNVRCLVNFEFRPGKLSLLLGPNGGGKSTVLEVLDAVRFLVRGGQEVSLAFPSQARTSWETRRTQRIELEVAGQGGTYMYVLEIEHDDKALPPFTIIRSESVTFDGKPLFRFANSTVFLFKDDHATGPSFPFSPRRSFLASLEPSSANTRLTWFLQWLDRVWSFKLDPSRLRQSWLAEREERWLSGNGDNFAAFYRHVVQEMPDVSSRICSDLKDSFVGIQQVLLRSRGEAKGLMVSFAPPGVQEHELPFFALSDGQAMLVALYVLLHAVAHRATLLCIDEPDNFVALPEIQPWLVRLGDVVESGEGQAILVSHNPEVIDYLASDSAFLVDSRFPRAATLEIPRCCAASRSSSPRAAVTTTRPRHR